VKYRPLPGELQDTPDPLRLKSPSERLLMQVLPDRPKARVLVLLIHGTTLATAVRTERPGWQLVLHTPEHFFLRTLEQFHCAAAAGVGASVQHEAAVTLSCAADLPAGEFDCVLFATHAGDSSEQAQEFLQEAQRRLRADGCLVVSTNNPRDRWIQAQVKELFHQVDVTKDARGVACVARRPRAMKKPRGFRARFGFRFGDRVLMCESRPGVFSHRRLDAGTRALIKSLDLVGEGVGESPPSTIIEIGCGSGGVSIAAAVKFPAASVLALDGDARAVECTQVSAALNGITSVTTKLTSTGDVPDPGTWDLLLGNPPYYSDFRIAELFLQTARRSLRAGGRVHIVSKPQDWYEARMKQLFADVRPQSFGEYVVYCARQR
jgi:16S rRNA (guanine1207-N2)-methyltransferase